MFEPKKKFTPPTALKLPGVYEFKPQARALIDKRQTEDDKENPHAFDNTPMTEAEAIERMKVEAALSGMVAALQRHRSYITLQQLAEMSAVTAEIEGELPEIDGKRHGMFLFTISGTFQGRKVDHCLLGGDVMIISAESPAHARKLAQEGLNDTLEHARSFAFAQEMGVDLTQQNRGIAIDTEVRKKK